MRWSMAYAGRRVGWRPSSCGNQCTARSGSTDASEKSKNSLSLLILLKKKKKVLNAIIFKEIKKKFQGNPSLENLKALNCLETQFQGFQGAKSSFQAF